MAAVCVLVLLGDTVYQVIASTSAIARLKSEEADLRRGNDAEQQQEQASLAATIAGEEKQQNERLANKALLSGEFASQAHEKEWARRLGHEAALAKTVMEKNLLQMESVGRDPTIAAQQALEAVASLAAPRGSKIEVQQQDGGYSIKVAFRMSALSAHESGAVTKHHSTESMREEMQVLSARVMKAMFDYCGSREIQKMSVTCNHALHQAVIPSNATEEERQILLDRAPVIFGRLYRVSLDQHQARTVADWRAIPTRTVIPLMTVEFDGLGTLQISNGLLSNASDPIGDLEF